MNGIISIDKKYYDSWVNMGLKLWTDHPKEDLTEEFLDILKNENEVGFIEGIYVEAEYRKKGIAKLLIKKAETWSQSRNCIELGSDILLDNQSQNFIES